MDLYREIVSSFFKEYQNVQDIQNSQNDLNVPDEQVEDVPIPISKTAAGHNHLILREIAKYLPISDLKILRLVNHHWNNNYSDAYFRASRVTLKSVERLAQYTTEMEPDVHSKFDIEIQSMIQGSNVAEFHPFFGKYGHQILKLQFANIIWTSGIEDLQGWLGLLRTLRNIKELEITWNFWGHLPPIPFAIPILPSLQKLTIEITDNMHVFVIINPPAVIDLNDWNFNAVSLVNVVLTMAPNLKSLNLLNMFQPEFYRVFTENVALMPPPLLQELLLCPNAASLGVLQRLPIHLTKLTIAIQTMEIMVYDQLYEFLQIQKDTLKFLFLDVQLVRVGPQNDRILLRLPEKLANLENLMLRFNDRLRLTQQQWENVQFPMPPIMNYSEGFPKLETIWVSIAPCQCPEGYRKIVHSVIFPDGGFACTTVKQVELQNPSIFWMLMIHRVKLGNMFPNAEILSMKNL